jgi:hypothetical protein
MISTLPDFIPKNSINTCKTEIHAIPVKIIHTGGFLLNNTQIKINCPANGNTIIG